MTSSSLIKSERLRSFRFAHSLRRSAAFVLGERLSSARFAHSLCRSACLILRALVLASVFGLAGCIADTAEDTDLPWASNKGWEGMAPIAPAMMDRYE